MVRKVILWFRHGLRLHDNPSLHAALGLETPGDSLRKEYAKLVLRPENSDVELYPVFIFDGETAGTKVCGYNRMTYLLECLEDLDKQLRQVGGRLHLFRGDPVHVFDQLKKSVGFDKLCYEQDCEPVWKNRDDRVNVWCRENGVEVAESVGHTLWDPHEIIRRNGGSPPVTFSMFTCVTDTIGNPPRPLPWIDLSVVNLAAITVKDQLGYLEDFPTPEDFGYMNTEDYNKVYVGGERNALANLETRLEVERLAFKAGSYLPNRRDPDILMPPKSLSPDLRFGSLSIRKFYWSVLDLHQETIRNPEFQKPPGYILQQLLWREFFYTMSVNNEFYSEMERNDICLNIPWYPAENNELLVAFTEGRTGYPFIDAGIKQLKREGWLHHIVRNALACFLTRGDLWISWEEGLTLFFKYLIDADWSVCAGNWMWVSSSAFEKLLNCSSCIDPGTYGRRVDPWGNYIRRYVPVLKDMPVEYVYEPWKAPLKIQEMAGCVVGKDYPARIVVHEEVSRRNVAMMSEIRDKLFKALKTVPRHVGPSDEIETRHFMGHAMECKIHPEDIGSNYKI